jgi:outer membrane protein assembly complex protein YaeT
MVSLAFLALLAGEPAALGAKTGQVEQARFEISGYGYLGNRELRRLVRTLQDDALKQEYFDATFVEDTALILFSRLHQDGFLRPTLDVRLTLANGEKQRVRWQEKIEPPLTRPMMVRRVRFVIWEGVRSHYQDLQFEGLTAMSEKQARSYFMETGLLLPLHSTRVFTPEQLRHALANLVEVLQGLGYEDARATASELNHNDKTGAVRVRVQVGQGAKSIVRSVRIEQTMETTNQPATARMTYPAKPFSRLWLQDFRQSLKATNYALGYPDTQVDVETLRREVESDAGAGADSVQLDLLAHVRPGPLVRVGSISFEGEKTTKESVMARRVSLAAGDLLNPSKAEQGRTRLARLGTFDTVQLRYEPVDVGTRNVIYEVKEARPFEVNLLAGYGSYERLRAGFNLEQKNILGLAHHARLRAIQSFKSSRGEFTYTMPELLGENLDVFLNGFGLRREEVSFTREEYGGGIGVRRYFRSILSDISVRYNYQVLNAASGGTNIAQEGPQNPGVGSIITDFRHDRRDNPLYPRRGYKVLSTLEVASEYLAGEVNYQRFEVATSYHHPTGGGRLVSLGLSHGLVGTVGTPAEDLPVNKRFFPGGEYSIRGFQDGEAAPRDADGKIIGAQTYSFGSIEFEQSLTPKWAIVVFSDSITFARGLKNYPSDEWLFSVGGGLRWRTIIGPVRLEYGHNLNPRPKDPSGTLHFSLGFPF